MRTETEIQATIDRMEKFCEVEHYTTEEMQGKIQALKYVLNTLGQDLF